MIIGITGTNGAGKGTIVKYLVTTQSFKHYSVREFLYAEIRRRGMPLDRTSLNIVGNDLRKTYGPGYIAEQLLGEALNRGRSAIIESIRSIGEAEFLHTHGALLWAIDADRQLRYQRVILRGTGTDHISFEEFCAQEEREMHQTEKYDMNIFGVMQMADHLFLNNGTPEDLYLQVKEALEGVVN